MRYHSGSKHHDEGVEFRFVWLVFLRFNSRKNDFPQSLSPQKLNRQDMLLFASLTLKKFTHCFACDYNFVEDEALKVKTSETSPLDDSQGKIFKNCYSLMHKVRFLKLPKKIVPAGKMGLMKSQKF